jgi:hypothetical protein
MSSSVTSRAEWQNHVARLLPSLSASQAKVLGLISYGIIQFDSCGMTRLSKGLAKIEQVPAARLRQRLREFYYEASAKRGKKRREVDVQACFGELLAGLLQGWEGEKQLALSLDASQLGERFTVLNLSVMYRGCGIPVAWIIIPARQEGSWRPHWEALLEKVAGVVPKEWKVIVMADRGLYAAWLFEAIQQLGWHPLLRVNDTMGFRADGEADFAPIGTRVRRRGRGWKGRGAWSEAGERMRGTLLCRWEKGYDEQVAVVTDLPEEEVEVAWYLMRFWIEGEYKDHKRGGARWEQTKMVDAKRAERLWLAMAVAMHVAVLVGGLEEAQEQEQRSRKGRQGQAPRRVGRPVKPVWKPRGREQSCLVRGQQSIQAAALRAEALPMGYVVSEPWPTRTYALRKPTSNWVKKRKEQEATRRQKQRRRQRVNQQQATACQQAQKEKRKSQQQASRARAAQRKALLKHEQEAEEKRVRQEQAAQRRQAAQQQEPRDQEQAQKRERRLRARAEDEQAREQRRLWHEQIKQEREARQQRQSERAARRASQALRSPSASFRILPSQQVLMELPEPP